MALTIAAPKLLSAIQFHDDVRIVSPLAGLLFFGAVTGSFYAACEVGDRLSVTTKPGAPGMEWVVTIRRPDQ